MLGISKEIKYPGLNILPPGVERHVVNGGGLTACLLYTSPSPRDRTRSRMPSSA